MEHKKTVLFIESGIHGGGSFTSLKKHILALDLEKIEPIVAFFNQNNYIKEFEDMGIQVFLIKDTVFSVDGGSKQAKLFNKFYMKGLLPFFKIKLLLYLHRKAIQELSDILILYKISYIHCNTELFRDRVGVLLSLKTGVPVISHIRSKYELGRIKFDPVYVKLSNQIVSKFIFVSEDTRTFWVNEVGLKEEKSLVLYDYFILPGASENSEVQNDASFSLLCVASLVEVKGHYFLIDSLRDILLKYSAKLFLVGGGDENYTNELKAYCKDKGLAEKVVFLGFRSDVPSLIASADIIYLLSKREGMPNILIEALGMGATVVGSKVGGIPEIIYDKETGFLVEYGDQKKIGSITRSILEKEVDTQQTSKNAKTLVEKKFSLASYKQTIENLYE